MKTRGDEEFTSIVNEEMGKYQMEGREYSALVTISEFCFFPGSLSGRAFKGRKGLIR